MIGQKLGPYEVLAKLGEGGMGVVYRAHDSRLGRDVAIKVSAERFTERFEREARAVAALNHPNICTLHDVGPDHLVMELVEGNTLLDILAHRPRSSPGLPADETLRIARQIASALDAAHAAGIVHRDLKPGNIKVKEDGTIKVLDFGLAKITQAVGTPEDRTVRLQPDLSASPTITSPALMTTAGVILGTAAYMSPEQARGKVVDKRADIWAFGVIVYEMLTGTRPFGGEDVSTTVAAVINGEPQWDLVPARFQRLVRKCLEKDPRQRLRDIGDVWALLDEPQPVAAAASSRIGGIGWIAAALMAIVAGVALWAPWRSSEGLGDRPMIRLEIDLGPNVSLSTLDVPTPSTIAISPDGMRLAYLASVSGGPPKIFTRRLDQPVATELVGTEGGVLPFLSPDGEWVVFYDGTRLKRVSVAGGAVVPMAETPVMAGLTWTDDGNLIVGSGLKRGLLRVPFTGGPSTPIVDPMGDELFYAAPQALPGRNEVLVTVFGTPPGVDRAVVDIISLNDRSRTTIVRGAAWARYLPSGHVIYTNRSTMFAAPFDLEARTMRGSPVPVLNDVAFDATAGLPQLDISGQGTLVYRPNTAGGGGVVSLAWIDAGGNRKAISAKAGQYNYAALAPDGTRVALVVRDGANQDIWVYDIERDTLNRVTFGGQTFVNPVWSPDGRYVVFGSVGNGVFSARADGGGQPQQLLETKALLFPSSFSPDGKRLAYFDVSGSPQLFTVPIDTSAGLKGGQPERYLTSQFADVTPMISPDGRWLAYESNESGRPEIYVRAFPATTAGQGGKWQISNNGGTFPVWMPGGREILYRSGDQLISVGYTATGDSFVPHKPRVWLSSLGGALRFSLAPDGKRVLVLSPESAEGAKRPERTLIFVQNFFDELRRRVPVGN